jgi:molybdate transport system substrate-binding protein
MDFLEREGRIEGASRKSLLSNRLVIVVSNDSGIVIRAPTDLLRADVRRIALADPAAVPADVYAKKYLEGEKIWDPLKSRIIPVKDVRAALATVELGNVDAGIVYKTDAAISKKVKVAFEVPAEKGPPILYPLAVVEESKKKKEAYDLLN